MSFVGELKRRNVIRVGAAYAVAAWLLIQVAETLFPLFGFDDTPARIVVIVLAIGLIPVLIAAWAFELTKDRKFYRVGEVWGTESERELTRRYSIEPIVRVPEGVVV